MEKIKTITCPLDCYDLCMIDVHVENNQIVKLIGNDNHPMTRGFICQKGRNHLKRHNDSDRIKSPMKKIDDKWIGISYEEAENLVVEHLQKYDLKSIIHYNDSGYTGIGKEVDELFFNHLGGVVKPRGSLCWSAGMKATKDTFKDVISTDPEEMENSDIIILWGRNPVETNIHLANRIVKAKKNGTKVILIDPIATASKKISDTHIIIKPDTDNLLALSMIKSLVQGNSLDIQSIKEKSTGLDKFLKELENLSIEEIEKSTGVDIEVIENLALEFIDKKIMIYIGYGLQRYYNGGNTVKSINALGFITENYGKAGCGINYANKGFSKKIHSYLEDSEDLISFNETFVKSKFGKYIIDNDIKMLFVTKSNPLVQLPNLNLVKKAVEKVEFKVGVDLFMTDTMEQCDLVFPATSVFEEDDVFYTSMYSPYLQYSEKVIGNSDIKGEYELFQSLAKRMKLDRYPMISKEEYLKHALRDVLEEYKLSYDEFKNKKFLNLKNKRQYDDLVNFSFVDHNGTLTIEYKLPKKSMEYPLRLITPKPKDSMHSQGFKNYDGKPIVYMSQNNFTRLVKRDLVLVESIYGEMIGKPEVIEISDELILIHEGYWQKSGSVNMLTTDDYSDVGDQAAYYDTFVKIRGV
jgi:anaerobic selenocysteine-containing dehydrogenase